MKNLNGNSIFVDRQTAEQNKIAHEVWDRKSVV